MGSDRASREISLPLSSFTLLFSLLERLTHVFDTLSYTHTHTHTYTHAHTHAHMQYRSLLPMYYRNAAAAIVVYDITSEATFDVLQEWITELHRLGPQNIVLAIAGNKCDLEEKREVCSRCPPIRLAHVLTIIIRHCSMRYEEGCLSRAGIFATSPIKLLVGLLVGVDTISGSCVVMSPSFVRILSQWWEYSMQAHTCFRT